MTVRVALFDYGAGNLHSLAKALEAGGALVMRGYERDPAPWAWQYGPPGDFNHTLLPEDWERFEPLEFDRLVTVLAPTVLAGRDPLKRTVDLGQHSPKV